MFSKRKVKINTVRLYEIQVIVIYSRAIVRNPGNCYLQLRYSFTCDVRVPCKALSVKPGLGHWQTEKTKIRSLSARRLIRVCAVCFNYRKLR